MANVLEKSDGTVGVGRRAINNLRFADNIDLVAESREELAELA